MLKKIFRSLRRARIPALSESQVLEYAQHNLRAELFSRHSISVVQRLQEAGYQAFLVGGCVRDALLGLRPKDFDVATNATPDQVRSLFRNARIIGRRFRLVHVLFGWEMVEVATFRSNHSDKDAATGRAAQDKSGRILRDNVFGTLEQDAQRRDFSVNALYYDPVKQRLHDFSNGLHDLQERRLRLIGDPRQRYQEDPVRMLRAVRFVAKLGLDMEPETALPIRELAHLLGDIPPARLYDEVLKLFLAEHAEETFRLLNDFGLFAVLFPQTTRCLHPGSSDEQLVTLALRNTDQRLQLGKSVTPAFLFAALLWPARNRNMEKQLANGHHPAVAAQKAAQQTLQQQAQHITIPKRFSIPMTEIWLMQERLPQRSGHKADGMLAHPRFRAAYDFLLLREDAGEIDEGLGQWWTLYQEEDEDSRQRMVKALGQSKPARNRKRRPRIRKPANQAGAQP